MALTPQQRSLLAAAIRGDQDLAVVSALAIRNDTELTRLYNQPSTFVVWRSSVRTAEVGYTVNYIAVEALTDINRGRITTFYTMNPESFEPRADIRSYWASTFSGALGGQGQAARDALEALWRRFATKAEAVFATGTGTTATPGALTFSGQITTEDVGRALNDNP